MREFHAAAMPATGKIALRDGKGGELLLSRTEARAIVIALQGAERAFQSGEAFDDERRAMPRAFAGPLADRSARTLAEVDRQERAA